MPFRPVESRWWTKHPFSTNRGVLNKFREQVFGALNRFVSRVLNKPVGNAFSRSKDISLTNDDAKPDDATGRKVAIHTRPPPTISLCWELVAWARTCEGCRSLAGSGLR